MSKKCFHRITTIEYEKNYIRVTNLWFTLRANLTVAIRVKLERKDHTILKNITMQGVMVICKEGNEIDKPANEIKNGW